MLNNIYDMILINIIIIIINIGISIYINSDEEYYGENYISHYFKLKNMPTIIPYEYGEPEYDFEDYDEGLYFKNFGLNRFPHLTHNNKYNESNKFLNYCYSLLSEFIFCLNQENENEFKCQNLFSEKIDDLESCDIINMSNSINDIKKNIIFFNISFDEMNNDLPDEFQKEKKFNQITEFKGNFEEKKIDLDNANNNQIILSNVSFKENIKETKDCVEYGLTNDDHIICTKYE